MSDRAILRPGQGSDLLTDDEHAAIHQAGELANLICRIVGDGETAEADRNEAVTAIHHIQRMIAAQAAARAYPDRYRLLGGVTKGADSES